MLRIAIDIWWCIDESHVFNMSFLCAKRQLISDDLWSYESRARLKIVHRQNRENYAPKLAEWSQCQIWGAELPIRESQINDMRMEKQNNQSPDKVQFVFPASSWWGNTNTFRKLWRVFQQKTEETRAFHANAGWYVVWERFTLSLLLFVVDKPLMNL